MLFSKSLIILHFAFRSMIHFELIFVKNLRFVSRFIFLACGCSVVLAPFTEETVFGPLYCHCSFVKDQLTMFMSADRSVSGFSTSSH